ncbi:MAG: TorF family putative porin [Planctomycetota bacterium]
MTKESKLTGLCLVGGLAAAALTTSSIAQDAPPAVNNGLLTFGVGADVVSTYMFRGIEQEDSGLIIQPWVEVGAPLGDTGLDLTVGTWQSIHSAGTGATGTGASRWYESDLYAGLGYTINDQFAVSATFTGFYSPNGAFADIEEIAFGVEYDDSEIFGDYAFAPYALLAIETRDAGGSEDVYLELGGAFSAFFIESEDLPVELSFPFALGLSIDDYYTDGGGDNEFFGFLKVGAAASMPLDFIPADYGVWTASAGLDLYLVNDDAGLLDSGDDFEIAALVGVSMEY